MTVTYWVDIACGWSVVVNVPSGIGEGAPVVAAGCGAGLEGLGWTDIVVSAGIAVVNGAGSMEGEGVASGERLRFCVAEGDGVMSAGVGLVVRDPKTVASPFDARLATTELPNTSAASPISVQLTTTPLVLFIGMAKHSVPGEQTVVMTKLPAELQFPTFPAMQAISPDMHGEEKLSVEKRLL